MGPTGDTLNQLLADALRGIETGLWFLRNHRHAMTDQSLPFAVRQSRRVDAIGVHAVDGDPLTIFSCPTDSFDSKAFPGAGFTYQTTDLAFSRGQADAIDGFHSTFVGSKLDS